MRSTKKQRLWHRPSQKDVYVGMGFRKFYTLAVVEILKVKY